MTATANDITAKERILSTATELFYRQGYQATGVNQIIEKSGVAKATFYSHFPAKEALCLAYMERMSAAEMAVLEGDIKKRKTPLSRYMAPIEVLEPWLLETSFRGCPFLNIAPEVADPHSPIRAVGAKFYSSYRGIIERLTQELVNSQRKKYAHLKPSALAEEYMTILVGSVALSEIYHSITPLQSGVTMVKKLLL